MILTTKETWLFSSTYQCLDRHVKCCSELLADSMQKCQITEQNNEMPERFLEIPPIANAILPLFSLVSFLRVQELRRDLATPFASTFFAVNNELAKIRAVLIES
ncbi:hypothetical protein ABG067_006443 [Albugo candida]|uniref:Uncharacterized protein n=1 Tax=Albugo candida TaxID=65357 RepID=A0A024G5M0_9STRA|nr:unnamed protein product [Albugo candida]|eukprot:CCI42165.1 unnamed protein product [Albugo candida]